MESTQYWRQRGSGGGIDSTICTLLERIKAAKAHRIVLSVVLGQHLRMPAVEGLQRHRKSRMRGRHLFDWG